ncbi:MAG: phosphoglycerate mutase [Planctomycetaceae bacterium]|nr:MAG: phosphoglycerate mutase [Planctomycetaceae bacterium]
MLVVSTKTRMILVRHGSTAANEQQPYILQGCEIDQPLTPLGEWQSATLAQVLQPYKISAIYSSTLIRSRQTAEYLAQSHGIPVTPIHDLRECSVGRWEGKDWQTIRREEPELYAWYFSNPADHPHPSGESYRQVLLRAQQVFQTLFERHQGETFLVVGHNMLNRAYLSQLIGIDLRHARRLKQANCCINLVEMGQEQTELVMLNSILHLKCL